MSHIDKPKHCWVCGGNVEGVFYIIDDRTIGMRIYFCSSKHLFDYEKKLEIFINDANES